MPHHPISINVQNLRPDFSGRPLGKRQNPYGQQNEKGSSIVIPSHLK